MADDKSVTSRANTLLRLRLPESGRVEYKRERLAGNSNVRRP